MIEPDLETIQKIVDGYFTTIYVFPFKLNPNVCKLMYLNEEGELKNLPIKMHEENSDSFHTHWLINILVDKKIYFVENLFLVNI